MVSFDDIHENDPLDEALSSQGITTDYLASKLKRELNAKKTHTLKVKGAMKQEDLPKGFKVSGTSGVLSYDKKGKEVHGDGDTVVHFNEVAWDVRQRARIDAHKLKGDYPAEKKEISGPGGGPISIAVRLKAALERGKKVDSPDTKKS